MYEQTVCLKCRKGFTYRKLNHRSPIPPCPHCGREQILGEPLPTMVDALYDGIIIMVVALLFVMTIFEIGV